MKVSIQELIKRPLLSNDNALEVFNKMTKEELVEYDNKIMEDLKDVHGIDKASLRLAKDIDYNILYEVIKQKGIK